MGNQQEIKQYLLELKKRFKREMPKVRGEIRIYEEKKNNGQLTKNPIPSPQFSA